MTLQEAKQLIAVFKNADRVPKEYGPILIRAANIVRNATKKRNPKNILGVNIIRDLESGKYYIYDYRFDEYKDGPFNSVNDAKDALAYYKSIRRYTMSPRRHSALGFKTKYKGGQKKHNPPKPVMIYGSIGRIEGTKTQRHICDDECVAYGHRYYHNFKSKPKMYGLPDGSLLVTNRRM